MKEYDHDPSEVYILVRVSQVLRANPRVEFFPRIAIGAPIKLLSGHPFKIKNSIFNSRIKFLEF